jgi:hypothetical protein
MRTTSLLLATVIVSGWVATSSADDSAFGRCSIGTSERLTFVEDRLEQRRRYADWWWKGWTAFYGIGTVVESVQAGTEDDGGKRADYIVSAVKAVAGTTRTFLFPPPARMGADPMRVVDPHDEPACRERLRIGEELLRTNAKASRARWDWWRHALNVGINVAGGLIVAEGFDEPSRGWRNAGIGIAVGEAYTFSYPWKGDDDLEDYERRFGTGDLSQRPVSFTIAPRLGGLQLGVTF